MAGHPPNIKSPEHLQELFNDYCREIELNPRVKVEYVGKDGNYVETPLRVPYTFEGFKDYCWEVGVGTVEQYFTNQAGLYDKYVGICSHIKNKIRRDQIEGGMVGQYNPSITQRLNALKDNQDVTTNDKDINSVTITIVPPKDGD